MPDAFIWYEMDEKLEPALLNWMQQVEAEADIRGAFYIRKQDDGRATFMESYYQITTATINRIERLAAKQALFENIERRCESFIRIDPYE
jgi:hypothetical protein